jgi:hypothetical protein
MLKIKEIMQRETLFDVQFYAFLNAYVRRRLSNKDIDEP